MIFGRIYFNITRQPFSVRSSLQGEKRKIKMTEGWNCGASKGLSSSGRSSSVGAKSIAPRPLLLLNLFHRRNSRRESCTLDISRDRRIRGSRWDRATRFPSTDRRTAREKINSLWNAFKMLKWPVVSDSPPRTHLRFSRGSASLDEEIKRLRIYLRVI